MVTCSGSRATLPSPKQLRGGGLREGGRRASLTKRARTLSRAGCLAGFAAAPQVAARHCPRAVPLLLQLGADVAELDLAGRTALHYAAAPQLLSRRMRASGGSGKSANGGAGDEADEDGEEEEAEAEAEAVAKAVDVLVAAGLPPVHTGASSSLSPPPSLHGTHKSSFRRAVHGRVLRTVCV